MKTYYYIYYNSKGEPDFWANVKYRLQRKVGDLSTELLKK